MSALARFLGDSPLRVLLKLVVISFLVGVVMSAFGWSPFDIIYGISDFLLEIWNMGFPRHRPVLGLFPAWRCDCRAGLPRCSRLLQLSPPLIGIRRTLPPTSNRIAWRSARAATSLE